MQLNFCGILQNAHLLSFRFGVSHYYKLASLIVQKAVGEPECLGAASYFP